MKILYLSIIIGLGIAMLVIGNSNLSFAQYGLLPSEKAEHSAILTQAVLNATSHALQQQIQLNEEQHFHDLQVIVLLIALSIGLGCVIVALVVILFKNRK